MKDLDWVDILLHIPLALVMFAAAYYSPTLAVALFLLVREGGQKDPDFFKGLMIWRWSLQKHMEWAPQVVLCFLLEVLL